jgi:hypothetical protein
MQKDSVGNRLIFTPTPYRYRRSTDALAEVRAREAEIQEFVNQWLADNSVQPGVKRNGSNRHEFG